MVTELTYDLTQLKTALGECAAFKTWTGEATAAGAKAHVHLYSDDAPDLPICVLCHGNWKRELVTLGGDYQTQPETVLVFMEDVTKTTSDSAVFENIMADVSAIMQELETKSATYVIDAWYPDDDTPVRAKDSSNSDYVECRIRVVGDVR